MRSALRRMGNSTGLIVPRPVLAAAGLSSGATLDLTVEDGKIIATPVSQAVRSGWAEAAAAIAALPEGVGEADWRAFGLDDDEDLTW
jgi:antitoxin MazE